MLSSSAVWAIYVNMSSAMFAITVNNYPNGDAGVNTWAELEYLLCKNTTACSINSLAFNLVLDKNINEIYGILLFMKES